MAETLLRILLPEREKHDLLGDYEEYYKEIFDSKGRFIANLWYWMQIVNLIPKTIWNSTKWSLIMIRNYLKIALRTIKRNIGFSLINVIGLAAGMTCCILIFLFVNHELSYDRHYKDHDRIYRVAMEIRNQTGTRPYAPISPKVAPTLRENYPQVESAVRILDAGEWLVRRENTFFYEHRTMFADPDLFHIFTIPFILGDPQEALKRPGTMVISQKIAHKYFGTESPLGKILNINQRDYEVTGVVTNAPETTHLKYDLIASTKTFENAPFMNNWHVTMIYTYIKLKPNVDVDAFSRQIFRLADPYVGEALAGSGTSYHYFIQPLTSIHIHSHLRYEIESPRNPVYLTIFSVVGIFILLIACLNFINLTTARSAIRAPEVGMRKVVGANRRQLVCQFLGESMMMTLIALIIAIGLAGLLTSLLSNLTGSPISYSQLFKPLPMISLFVLSVLVGLTAGMYPALVLSGFRPASTFKGTFLGGSGRFRLRSILVVVQFSISIFLVIGTWVVHTQLHFMQNQYLGFDKEQKLILPLRGGISVKDNYEAVKDRFASQPSITGVTVSSHVPGRGAPIYSVKLVGEEDEKNQTMFHWYYDHDFISQYGIEIRAGRGFQENMSTDITGAFLINEAALKFFGWRSAEEAIGKRLWTGNMGRIGPIIGVTADFHYRGLQTMVEPLVMEYVPEQFQFITLSVNINNLDETMALIESIWNELFPANPYEGYFLDTGFDRQYKTEIQMGSIFSIFTFLGLFIACLGLLGLASFTAQQRTKEIGIRKVLGASVSGIFTHLSVGFVKWVVVANIISWPTAYFFMNKWLHNFAYRTNLNIWIFMLSGLAALVIALLTVSYQTIKAAAANPVEALRYE